MNANVTEPVIAIDGNDYMKDAKGALVPKELVKPQHRLEDDTVRKMMGYALDLNAQIARFKNHTFDDLNAFQSLLEDKYGARAGGKKGNVTFQSFDSTMKVQVQIADQVSFGPELQQAKNLVDECLVEWGAESRPELRALVNRVFAVEKEGEINKAELFSMLRMEIEDPRWVSAMDAIRDAIRVTGTKEYVRFYQRNSARDPWQPVTIDLAKA